MTTECQNPDRPCPYDADREYLRNKLDAIGGDVSQLKTDMAVLRAGMTPAPSQGGYSGKAIAGMSTMISGIVIAVIETVKHYFAKGN